MSRMSKGRPDPRTQQSKVKKRKSGTATSQKHRFQSFTERIARLNIDAVRRNQSRQSLNLSDESYFRAALEDWRDRNLSEVFTDFVRKVEPISQNLPQIIHYEHEISEILHAFIRKGDALSLEPLLVLVAQFAHDLGTNFEKHFQTLVEVISSLAATHSDVAVIEWSFTCLAWLFKYLAKLLVPDLRPLYGLMAPLLGKQHQKEFITRFAAEAMSFLVRKAALGYIKNSKPLDQLVRYAFDDLCALQSDRSLQYRQGLAALFAEAVKGVKRGINSGATATIRALINHLKQQPPNSKAYENVQIVVQAVIIDVIHHTDSEGFEPVIANVLECTTGVSRQDTPLSVQIHVWYVIIGTKKGSRIVDWAPIFATISKLVDVATNAPEQPSTKEVTAIMSMCAMALQYGPFDLALSFGHHSMLSFEKPLWETHTADFCGLVAELGRDRFDSMILPGFQR